MLNAVESLRDAKLSVLTLERAAQVVQSHVTMHRALMLACLSCFVLQLADRLAKRVLRTAHRKGGLEGL